MLCTSDGSTALIADTTARCIVALDLRSLKLKPVVQAPVRTDWEPRHIVFAAGNENVVFVVSTFGRVHWTGCFVMLGCVMIDACDYPLCLVTGELNDVHIPETYHQIAHTPSGVLLFTVAGSEVLCACEPHSLVAERREVKPLRDFKRIRVFYCSMFSTPHYMLLSTDERCVFVSSTPNRKIHRIDLSPFPALFLPPIKHK